jgi:colanic acid biosynthesis glycosyl transferase WcaI
MRMLVLGTNYVPEKTAVAPFATGLCEHLASSGNEVKVITAFPYYPEWKIWEPYRGKLYLDEEINGVSLRRVWHYVPSRGSTLRQRMIHDLSFTVGAFLAGLFAGGFDVIHCTCPPPTLALAAYVLSRIRRRPYVLKLTDLASDAAVATGILKEGFLVRIARLIEGFAYRKADRVVCLCQPFIEKLSARGIDRSKLLLIPDWGDIQRVYPIANATVFRNANRFTADQFLVMHTGNMGKKQELLNVVRAAELSQDVPGLVWILVGGGEERTAIEEAITRSKLQNIRMLPLQPVEMMAEMYSAADVLLLHQKAAVVDSVIPSKLLTYMAAGRPVLAAASRNSETARSVRRAECGVIIQPGDPGALVQTVLSLRNDPAGREKFGASGRSYVQQHFTKEKVLHEYDLLFSRYVDRPRADARGSKNAVTAS